MTEPSHLLLSKLDPDWCLQQARDIVEHVPRFERSNSSGKFFGNYHCWHFYKDSHHPLIKNFVATLNQHAQMFHTNFGRPLDIQFLVLSHVKDATEEMCLYHKDQYFFNGQAHLTILGNANISVLTESPGGSHLIRIPNGSVWYLNSSAYMHRIEPSSGERFELCAPIAQKADHVERKLRAVSNHPYRYVDSEHPEWIKLRDELVSMVRDSVKSGRASNPKVAAFPTDFILAPEENRV